LVAVLVETTHDLQEAALTAYAEVKTAAQTAGTPPER
jgi:hypothetical protein